MKPSVLTRYSPIAGAAVLAAALLPAAPAAAADHAAFGAGVRAGVVDIGGDGVFEKSYLLSSYGSRLYAAASLTDGKLHAFASGDPAPGCPNISYCRGGRAQAYYWDTVIIHNGMNAGFATPWLSVDGQLSDLGSKAWVNFYAGGASSSFWSNIGAYAPRHDLASGTTIFNEEAMLVPAYGDVTMFIYASLTVEAVGGPSWGSFADFGNTLHFNWTLPEGATVTSASGQFMTTAVPEPASGALLLAGGLAVGFVARRRGAPESDGERLSA